MIMVDSSVWINYFNGVDTWHTDLLDRFLPEIPVVMGDLILTEVLQGFKSNKDFEKAKSALGVLLLQQMGGRSVAIASAQNYRILRKNRVTIRKTIDIIIGTFCILQNFSLLHDDKDFDPMAKYLSLKTIQQPFFE
ncbi:MAG: PIN domain-containing protein [Actinobacteria bacterium]|nr:PIN domain-containing protein [Actinomycetota bacterium]